MNRRSFLLASAAPVFPEREDSDLDPRSLSPRLLRAAERAVGQRIAALQAHRFDLADLGSVRTTMALLAAHYADAGMPGALSRWRNSYAGNQRILIDSASDLLRERYGVQWDDAEAVATAAERMRRSGASWETLAESADAAMAHVATAASVRAQRASYRPGSRYRFQLVQQATRPNPCQTDPWGGPCVSQSLNTTGTLLKDFGAGIAALSIATAYRYGGPSNPPVSGIAGAVAAGGAAMVGIGYICQGISTLIDAMENPAPPPPVLPK